MPPMRRQPANRSSSRIGLKEVAEACELSTMTVSRALNDAYGINPATRERVLSIARSLGYVRNRVASNLATRKTATVGVVIPDIDHTIFAPTVKGLEAVLSLAGLSLLLCCSYDDPRKEYQDVMALLERRVDGIVLVPASMIHSRATLALIRGQNIPLVLMDRMILDEETDSVTVTDYAGAYGAVIHLIEQGYRRIAHLAGPADIWTARERRRGFEEAMKAAGLQPTEGTIVPTDFSVAGGERAIEHVLSLTPRPEALFCVNDPVAIGAYKILLRRGMAIPGEMALVGFSNVLESEMLAVPLTTVHQDAMQIGRQTGELLLSRIQHTAFNDQPVRYVIPTQLRVRGSSLRKSVPFKKPAPA